MGGEAEGRRELAMEVVFRESGDGAQRIKAQIVVQMTVDVVEHALHPCLVLSASGFGHGVLRGEGS
ncbi:hypothetical protein AA23498_1512 [Acetobacter nitrogenifigens DSM 23921 = NBRC 105050]|uniref:Uncharacterized protein n=1 Tax=Acetobacter nitrogenifigens DSM 23921 = NBRC 105050 TaxID=1120919 RepID=A0A511XDW6_9PROT|nr:hypothetical protein AA23498_1512 [Acetobacter nitrogenifigens DSM 23921 = NBRC 105050]GEN61148.1 hypothetical protein ANI02nite_30320 [Acetobacter nitrogenifigens DSM 23921 = NBRC 105050]